MGDPNYPDDMARFNNDPRSPNYDDPIDTPAFEDKREEMSKERIQDVAGYFLESFTEAEMTQLQELVDAVLAPASEQSSWRIGDIVRDLVEGYCTPTDEQVLEELNQEPDE
jgi:hypothetical protein